MSFYRRYEPEETVGTPVDIKSINQRMALVGKRIEWNSQGSILKHAGIVDKVSGKNIMVDGSWYWATYMLNVKVSDESNGVRHERA